MRRVLDQQAPAAVVGQRPQDRDEGWTTFGQLVANIQDWVAPRVTGKAERDHAGGAGDGPRPVPSGAAAMSRSTA